MVSIEASSSRSDSKASKSYFWLLIALPRTGSGDWGSLGLAFASRPGDTWSDTVAMAAAVVGTGVSTGAGVETGSSIEAFSVECLIDITADGTEGLFEVEGSILGDE